ncbi:DUF4283 domain-containing protein, partial [Shigella flexneri]|nr:DUF4283 domain-containing protein [Shigella flexneri]
HKPVDSKALKAYFHRTWMVDKNFRVQEKVGDVFLFSFELIRDRNKVLRGGLVWYFDRAPVCFEEYDGIKPLHEAQLKHLRVWVRVSGIPPL